MGTVRIHEFTTLDGVIDTPSWTFDFEFDPEMGLAIGRLMSGCNAILLGRTTYEMFEPAWSSRTADDDPGAPFMNDTKKYVVSSSLEKATWSNSEIVGPYSAEAIHGIRGAVKGGIYVSGSGTLVRSLIADGLVDELHLFVFPVMRGEGPRWYEDGPSSRWTLKHSQTFSNGALYLAYEYARA